LICQFKELTGFDEKILDVIVLYELRYFVISTSVGNIFVWKFLESRKLEPQKLLVHSFSGHFASVPSICQMVRHQNLILSVSMDSTARIWSLDSFQMQYVFQLPNMLSLVRIFDQG
jgi:WD40 repeat protein